MTISITTVLGARPQFIKAATVSRALRAFGIRESLVHTGQHYDRSMSEVFFEELGIPAPDRHLGVGSGTHAAQTGAMLQAVEQVLLEDRPDVVLVYGDTNSTLAGALAASKIGIPVAHVEAGLRSLNRAMPEELNRVLTDHLATWLLCPTDLAVRNLDREGIGSDGDALGRRVDQVGDVMFDATRVFGELSTLRSTVGTALDLEDGGYVLATVHRAENTDDPRRLRRILEALARIAERRTVVWPMHPRTARAIEGAVDVPGFDRVRRIDPVGYLDMLWLEGHADVVLTDSGGVQKEAYFAGVPCVTLRDETEWVELIDTGWNRLAPPDGSCDIVQIAESAAPGRSDFVGYGDGAASERIAAILGEGPPPRRSETIST